MMCKSSVEAQKREDGRRWWDVMMIIMKDEKSLSLSCVIGMQTIYPHHYYIIICQPMSALSATHHNIREWSQCRRLQRYDNFSAVDDFPVQKIQTFASFLMRKLHISYFLNKKLPSLPLLKLPLCCMAGGMYAYFFVNRNILTKSLA